MAIKIVNILVIFVSMGASLPTKELKLLDTHLLQYHPNMTTMWMVDNYGDLVEVHLTGKPHHTTLLTLVEDNVVFFLYTREYNNAYKIIKNDYTRLRKSTFNPTKPTVIVIHGFWSNYQSDAVQLVREAYLSYYDVNVVSVDWGNLAKGPWYIEAVSHTESVGVQVAQLIDFLVSAGAKVMDIQLIGHSLGAHVSAFASNHVTSGRITRITGLDPALPLFMFRPPEERLDPSDADQVDCIHTCGGYLGFYTPLCSHDFYPNGGKASQPGCSWDITGSCSHGRSYRYYSVSIGVNFTAHRCSNFNEVQQSQCRGTIGIMGSSKIRALPGIYYLETSSYYPYIK